MRFAVLLLVVAPVHAATLGQLLLGNPDSEQSHLLHAEHSDIIKGGLDQPARRLLPLDPPAWEGGRLSFVMKVDPAQPTYLTARFWGSEVNSNRLQLFIDGKQVGYRHLGDIDSLDPGSDAPFCNGRFYYTTLPLPAQLTKGKQEVRLEIRSSGFLWGYGRTWEQYQKNLTAPTRGIYRVYTHVDPFFAPPADERQGAAPADPPLRKTPGDEVMQRIKERVNRELEGRLRDKRPMGQMQMQFVAQAYFVKWTPAHQNPRVVERLTDSLDALYRAYVKDPKLAQADPATPNADWFGLGPSGQVIALLFEQFKPVLDQPIDDGAGNKIARRAAFTSMLLACRDWHRQHRRQYTNQSMINDLYGIYYSNKAIALLDAPKSIDCTPYLYESVGLTPWRGSETLTGPSFSAGRDFLQLTAKGLTRELGYVGNYGEVLDWAGQIYNATRPSPDKPGDVKLKDQLARISRARAVFRYPALDDEGHRAMRLETVVGWRDTHFPGDIAYAQRPTWDGSPVEAAAATLDPHLVGYVQQMLEDNQFFASMQEHIGNNTFRVTAGLLHVPDNYDLIRQQPRSPHRLPMSRGAPDFVFADEQDGVVAIKHGDEILYASLYWRARHAVNFMARVHHITPHFERIATVRQEEEFENSGMVWRRPNWTNFGFANGGLKYPGDLQSAHAGEELPIAKIPDGIVFKPGQESLYAGRALFYKLQYGPYLIAMNASRDKTFTIKLPAGTNGRQLPQNRPVSADPIRVLPQSTLVLLVGK